MGPIVRRVDNFIQRIKPYRENEMCSLSNQNKKRTIFILWPAGISPLDNVIHSSYNRDLLIAYARVWGLREIAGLQFFLAKFVCWWIFEQPFVLGQVSKPDWVQTF